jgi:hypothetical protein
VNLLTKNIHDITFENVVEFCKQKVIEGTQLDYKLKTPKDLAKHFATFSNTQGGLVIIGVGEDSKGLPTTYDGVPNDGKLIDQIHQFAANVTPLPTYTVRATDEQNGNVFILIRIDEGAAAPYTTLSDPTVWIRTGNISTPASREELLRLANKKRDAETARNANLAFADQYFNARVEEAEQELKQLRQAGEENVYQHPLGTGPHSAILTIALQPYYPTTPLTTPQDLSHRLHEYVGRGYAYTVLSQGDHDTMPGGVAVYEWSKNTGAMRGEQLYANGLNNLTLDILDSDQRAGTRKIQITYIAIHLYRRLKLIQNYYKMTGYSGLIAGNISLAGGVGAETVSIQSAGHVFFPQNGKVRLELYEWPFEFDTNTLNNDMELQKVFKRIIRDISWSLGCHDIPNAIIENLLKVNGWLRS